ncbi:MAG: THUMP-like domain-containing protein, partial [Actinomycetes bacterium]
ARVLCGDATVLATELLSGSGSAVFCDPARRTARGRSWRTADLQPPWSFVRGLLDGARPACVKVGPGLPYADLPPDVAAEWVSHRGNVVELALWRLPGRAPARAATLLPAGVTREVEEPAPVLAVAAPGAYVFEPDGAAIRAGLVPGLGAELGLRRLDLHVAYLTGDAPRVTPWLTSFRVVEALPVNDKALRAWVRQRGIGVLEIKKRGLDIDPAQLRRRLRPSGAHAATLMLTPTVDGARALVVERMPAP